MSSYTKGDQRSGFVACESLMNKVYPMGTAMWEYQRGLVKTATGNAWDLNHTYLYGVMGFLKTNDEGMIACMNVPVHENTHVHNSCAGTFRPGNLFSYSITPPWEVPCTRGKGCQYPMEQNSVMTSRFPRRRELWDQLPEDVKLASGGPNYFKASKCDDNHEGGELGCQRVQGLMTETEAYLHGAVASSWLSTSVGLDNQWTPRVVPNCNECNQGAPFPIAFWSMANVYYLRLIATSPQYADIWNNLLGRGTEDWTSVSELFLAHIDRATWYLRLALDVNDLIDVWHSQGYGPEGAYKALANKCRKLQLEALARSDVLAPLRTAVVAGRGGSRP